ncbi:MAG: helix-turn-helix domain-containing protein [Paludibacteraceae bacterium]|nr:helix-turn-helix domain-containing protein [Paludibacteraceae bacterium]
MKNRIFEVMKVVGKNPTDFAATIEISPAVLSSIKSGRTKPTLFLIEKIKSVYPNININWLITGEGDMFTDKAQQTFFQENDEKPFSDNDDNIRKPYETPVKQTRQNAKPENDKLGEPEVTMKVENKRKQEQQEQWEVKTVIKPDDRKISQIIVLYNDGTFETLNKE